MTEPVTPFQIQCLSLLAPQLVLANNTLITDVGRLGNISDDSTLRFMRDYADPAFGWKVAARITESGQPFPLWPAGHMRFIWKAWLYQRFPRRFEHDPALEAIRKARAIHIDSAHIATRTLLEAVLLCSDSTVENVSEDTSIPAEVILAYTQLFFDVLDRREDKLYLRNQVYPHSRYEEMLESYFKTGNFGMMLKRTAYNQDRATVLAIGGFRNHHHQSMTAAQASDILQREFMVQALMLSTCGGLMFDKPHHAISGARGIIQAGKIGGVDTGSGTTSVGILSAAIAETLAGDVVQIKADFERKALAELQDEA